AIASAWVCERLVCCWHKPWQMTIAAILWLSSAVGATLAIQQQPYWPVVFTLFRFLDIRPRREQDMHWYVLLPTYIGVACLLYLSADTLLRLCGALIRRWQGDRATARQSCGETAG